ncbi:MAG: hypothetical protein IPL49_16530 [Saprospirales bacterium]|nr:hypothetical protein [Saprospirales bacterium]MBK8492442.1 hypothetical protein [Saprospirales bacterium]
MKKLLSIVLFSLLSLAGFSQTTKLTVNYKFANVEVGYDHDSKTQVLIDGEVAGESGVAGQTEGGSLTVTVPIGTHQLKIVNWALYEGNWEEHTIENDYSIDAIYETSHKFKKPEKLFLLFDLDNEMVVSWKKPVKVK